MKDIKFSIIIPVYQVEQYLPQCLESIIGQTYKNLEIILVHDIAEDRSGDICDSYAAQDKRIKVIHKEKEDVSSARNMGLDICTGDYVIFVDADDWIEEVYCENVYKIIGEYKEPDIVQMDYYYESKRTIPLKFLKCSDKEFTKKHEMKSLQLFVLVGARRNYGFDDLQVKNRFSLAGVWAKAFKKSMVKDLRFEGSVCEDLVFCICAFEESKSVVYLPEYLYHYRVHAQSACRRYRIEKIDAFIHYCDLCFSFFRENNMDERFYKALYMNVRGRVLDMISHTILHPMNSKSYMEKRQQLKYLSNKRYFYRAIATTRKNNCDSLKSWVVCTFLKYKLYDAVLILGKLRFFIRNRKRSWICRK